MNSIFVTFLFLVCLTPVKVRGSHINAAPLRDFYDTYYNAIDRMNEDYHMHFQLRNWPDGVQWGLHSAIFYFLNSTHALWEEHRVAHRLAQSGRRNAPAEQHPPLTIPEFVLTCAEALIAERQT
jgi:hypothetical protein